MRDIKFRGKIKGSNTGEHALDWAYGDLVKELSTGKCFIYDLSHFDETTLLKDVLIEVDPKTVGQYTGLKDKNGKKIYEGNIVKIEFDMFAMNFGLNEHIKEHGNKYEFVGEVKYYDGAFHIDNNKDEAYDLFHEISPVEVIGNIYENPELLEKGVK